MAYVTFSSRLVQQTSLFERDTPSSCRPFLKWAGGKRQLLPILLPRVPSLRRGRYHEPFIGGGALFFALSARGAFGERKARLSDINPELVNAYQVVRDQVDALMACLRTQVNEEAHFYAVRAQNPKELDPIERAARLLYLNKTCFNGLFRENQKGQFNVPFGHYPNPQICDEDTLYGAHHALQGVAIEESPFDETLQCAKPDDFVYFDPPYAPLSRTSSFVNYHAGGFHETDHIRLVENVTQLANRGVNVMLSNSAAAWVKALYQPFVVEEVYASRNINSKASGRGRVQELLVHAGPYARSLKKMGSDQLNFDKTTDGQPLLLQATA